MLSFGFLASCDKDSTEGVLDPKVMRGLLDKKLHAGMSLEAAKALMEDEGFECEQLTNTKWKGKTTPAFLKCIREDGELIKRRWEVAVINDGTLVSSYDIRSGLVYPRTK